MVVRIRIGASAPVTLRELKAQIETAGVQGTTKHARLAESYAKAIDGLLASSPRKRIRGFGLKPIPSARLLLKAKRYALDRNWTGVLDASYVLLSSLPGQPTFDPKELPKPGPGRSLPQRTSPAKRTSAVPRRAPKKSP